MPAIRVGKTKYVKDAEKRVLDPEIIAEYKLISYKIALFSLAMAWNYCSLYFSYSLFKSLRMIES